MPELDHRRDVPVSAQQGRNGCVRRGPFRLVAFCLATGLVVAAGIWRTRRSEQTLGDRFPPRGKFVQLEDVSKLHLVRTGRRCDIPVVLIHGSDGTLDNFPSVLVERIAEESDTIVVDRPGHGWSTLAPSGRASVSDNVALLREALRELGAERAILVGHSYGAAIALRWAIDHPSEVQGLILLSPAAYFAWSRVQPLLMRIPGSWVGRLLAPPLLPWIGPLALRWTNVRVGFGRNPVPPSFAVRAKAFYLRPSQFAMMAEEHARLAVDLEEMRDRYAEIAVPTAILTGAEDTLTKPGRQALPLSEAIPHSSVAVLPGLAHQMQWHAGDEVLEAIRRVKADAMR